MSTFFIIGADGREYGPASLDDLRQWVREHRADANSRVKLDTDVDWKRLGDLAELQDLFRKQVPPSLTGVPVGPPALPGGGEQLADQILARGYDLQIGECFSRGWGLLVGRFWLLVGASALVSVLVFGILHIPGIGVGAAVALSFVVLGGLYLLFLKELRREAVDISVVFAGFGPMIVSLLIGGTVATSLVLVGGMLCLVPGVYLLVCWHMFAPLLILDKRMEFWQALECSRRVVTRHWWICAGLLLLGVLAVSIGILACLAGAVITLPLSIAAIVVAYEQIFGEKGPSTSASLTPVPYAPVSADAVEPGWTSAGSGPVAKVAADSWEADEASAQMLKAAYGAPTSEVKPEPAMEPVTPEVDRPQHSPGEAVPPLPSESTTGLESAAPGKPESSSLEEAPPVQGAEGKVRPNRRSSPAKRVRVRTKRAPGSSPAEPGA